MGKVAQGLILGVKGFFGSALWPAQMGLSGKENKVKCQVVPDYLLDMACYHLAWFRSDNMLRDCNTL